MNKEIVELKTIKNFYEDKPDDVFICCTSFEERCLGVIKKFEDYTYSNGFIFKYTDQDEKTRGNLSKIKDKLSKIGSFKEIESSEDCPSHSISELTKDINKLNLNPDNGVITIDITTFTKRHVLLLLQAIDNLGLWKLVRLLYTEPEDYNTERSIPMSFGIKQIDTIPGFVSSQALNKPKLCVIFLGYENARAMALFNNLEPNETVLIIPRPAYKEEWENRTEYINRDLIKLVGGDKIRYLDSRNPYKVYSGLRKLFYHGEWDLDNWNCCISPLGTKPQLIGLYQFWREYPCNFSIIYGQSMRFNKDFYSGGIGRTWLLISP